MQIELCCICQSETGRAGASDDSIYREVRNRVCEFFNDGKPVCDENDDAVGPLCEDCNAEMTRLGFFPDD
jgi:hypothetical protein